MTTLLRSSGYADDPLRYIKRDKPPIEMEYLAFTQDTLALAVKNLGNAGDGSVVGAPAVSAAAMTFTDGNYIDTGVLETESMTLIALVQRHEAQVMFMGTDVNSDTNFIQLFTNGAAPRKPVFQARATSAPAAVGVSWAGDPLKYEMIAGIMNADTMEATLYLPRTAETVTVAYSGSRILSGRTVKVGAGPDPASAYAGDTTVGALYGVAQRALTIVEIDALFDWVALRTQTN